MDLSTSERACTFCPALIDEIWLRGSYTVYHFIGAEICVLQ